MVRLLAAVIAVCAFAFPVVCMAKEDGFCKCSPVRFEFALRVKTIERIAAVEDLEFSENFVIPAAYSMFNTFQCACEPGYDCQFSAWYDSNNYGPPPFIVPDPHGVCSFHADIYEYYDPDESFTDSTMDPMHCYDPHGRCN